PRGRLLPEPAVRAAVDSLSPAVRPVAAYHFGWCDERGSPTRTGSGEALRPALALLSAAAAGRDPAPAGAAAVAEVLVHSSAPVHDDVMDGDTTRRHRPTAWTVLGTKPAILAGDALLTLALDVLASSRAHAAQEGLRMLSATVLDLINGQSADLDFEERRDVGLEECVRMAEGKTSALLGSACALGAAFGGGGERVEALREFGSSFGTAAE